MVEFPGGSPQRSTVGFLVIPKQSGRYSAVIVIHEIWGLVDHIKNVANRLAREGFVALAVDLFDRKVISNIEEGRQLRQTLTEQRIFGDLDGAFNYLKTLEHVKPDRIGSIGFCMGGGLSLQLACRNRELAAAVVFYGRNPSPIDLVKSIRCPILGNYAGADKGIAEADIDLLKQTLAKHGKELDAKIYPGAPHGFFNDTQETYRPDAAKDAWERTLQFFHSHLGK